MDKVTRFIKQMLPAAKKIEEKEGFNHLFILAQIALETGWLEHECKDRKTGEPSYNLFNIKGDYNGNFVEVITTEYLTFASDFTSKEVQEFLEKKYNLISFEPVPSKKNCFKVRIIDKFKKYPSYEESILDWIAFLKKPRYESAYNVRHDLEKFANAIKSCGYATDPEYVSKILSIAKRIKTHPAYTENRSPSLYFSYVVQPGDTLTKISKRFNTTVEDIVKINNIKDPNKINVGERIFIPNNL